MELENKVTQLTEELARNPSGKKQNPDGALRLPRPPEKFSLQGHRAPITAIAFHPTFSAIVTCSEDTFIKVWDAESGEFERTLKGHTKTVQSIAIDPKGGNLGTYWAVVSILDKHRRSILLSPQPMPFAY